MTGPPEWFVKAARKYQGFDLSEGALLGLWRDEMEGELARAGYAAALEVPCKTCGGALRPLHHDHTGSAPSGEERKECGTHGFGCGGNEKTCTPPATARDVRDDRSICEHGVERWACFQHPPATAREDGSFRLGVIEGLRVAIKTAEEAPPAPEKAESGKDERRWTLKRDWQGLHSARLIGEPDEIEVVPETYLLSALNEARGLQAALREAEKWAKFYKEEMRVRYDESMDARADKVRAEAELGTANLKLAAAEERERELMNTLADYDRRRLQAFEQRDEARATVERVRAYARHKAGCAELGGFKGITQGSICNCGLLAALASEPKGKQ